MDKKNKKLVNLFISLALMLISFNVYGDIKVNEIMPCNLSTYRGDDTNYSGWVEFYNDGDDDVDIKGYVIKNFKKGGTEKWSWTINHSCKIAPDDYILYYFDGKGKSERHAAYKLDADGGSVHLYSGSKLIDSLAYTAMVPHISYGVYKDDDDEETFGYMVPTPKKDNKKVYTSLASRCAKPTFSTAPGVLTSQATISLSTSTSGAKIYYTLDGSEPTDKSTEYTSPIIVSKPNDDASAVVIRMRAYKSGLLPSAIATGSFIFMDSKHESNGGFTVPIVSLVIDKENYSGSQYGIGTVGSNGVAMQGKDCLPVANYNRDWDRPANFEYIVVDGNDKKAVVSQEVEVAVVGGCSRKDKVKSLKVNASKKTGKSTFDYSFFGANEPKEFKSLHIRNGGNGYDGFVVRDALLQEIARSMGLDCQHYQPVAYYINGAYQGLMGLRTRSNKDLIYAKYGIDEEDLDVVEVSELGVSAATGTKDAYDKLIETVKKNKASETYLEEVGKLMDIDYYIDYQILEQFIVNTDWPGNNTKLWRENKNGRFRWIVYDLDFGMGLYDGGNNHTYPSTDMIQFCLGKNPQNWANSKDFAVELYKNLMDNEDFRQRFLTRYLYHLENTFKIDNLKNLWEPVEEKVKNEFAASPISSGFTDGKNKLRSFAEERVGYVYGHLKSFYSAGEKVDLRIIIKDEDGNTIPNANVILNNVSTGTSDYSTKYFASHKLRIEPKVPYGYAFKKWETGSAVTGSIKTTPILDSKTTWSYYFKDTCPSGDWKALNYKTDGWSTGAGSFGIANKIITPTVKLKDGDSTHYITSYYRTKFTIDDLAAYDSFQVKVTYDDGVVIYVNGTEVKRRNMPSGTVKYGTFTPDYIDDEVATFFISKKNLVKGENVIAAEVHQYDGSSKDMAFELLLSGVLSGSSTSSASNEIFEGVVTSGQTIKAIYEKVDKVTPPTLQLNEICASNNKYSGNTDEFGNYPDWIEIYNYGRNDIDLAGMYLTDNNAKLKKSVFPYGSKSTIIKAGEYKVVYADNSTWRGPLHADFKISSGGGYIGLAYNKHDQVVVIDSIRTAAMAPNISYGRILDDTKWTLFSDCKGESRVTFADKNYDECPEYQSFNDYDSIGEVDPQGIVLYPNPAKDWISVEATGEFDDNEVLSGIREIEIYNANGMKVMYVNARGAVRYDVPIDRLATGIYYLRAVSEHSLFTATFKKE